MILLNDTKGLRNPLDYHALCSYVIMFIEKANEILLHIYKLELRITELLRKVDKGKRGRIRWSVRENEVEERGKEINEKVPDR